MQLEKRWHVECARDPRHRLFREPWSNDVLTDFDLQWRYYDRLVCALCGGPVHSTWE